MIIAFTGAGISKESGIITFQDMPGIREKLTRTYANRKPEQYREVMREFRDRLDGKEPNDAHKVLAEYNIPIITMNVDNLHELAGSKNIIKLHGRLPNDEELSICDRLYNTPVLYGDAAPMYQDAYDMVDYMRDDDILLVVGASEYTLISTQLRQAARYNGARVVEIQDNAATKVRKFIESHKDNIESFESRKETVDKNIIQN